MSLNSFIHIFGNGAVRLLAVALVAVLLTVSVGSAVYAQQGPGEGEDPPTVGDTDDDNDNGDNQGPGDGEDGGGIVSEPVIVSSVANPRDIKTLHGVAGPLGEFSVELSDGSAAPSINLVINADWREGALFNLTNGEIWFNEAPDYGNPQDGRGRNIYRLRLQAIDDDSGDVVDQIMVRVQVTSDYNAPPVLSVCDRTQQVEEAILRRVNGLPNISDLECEDVTRGHLKRVKLVYLQRKGVTTLDAADFTEMPNLKKIDLDFNPGLTSLPDGIFDGLTEMRDLELAYTGLTSLQSGIFDDMAKLGELSLKGNQFSSLPEGMFDNNTSLWTLSLQRNQLTSLPDGIFDNLTNLEELRLHLNPGAPFDVSVPVDLVVFGNFRD